MVNLSKFAKWYGVYVLIDATAFDDLSGNSYAGISSTTALSFTTVSKSDPTNDKDVVGLIEDADQVTNVLSIFSCLVDLSI